MTGDTKKNQHRALTLAFSPCPNDTFIFHGIASGRLRLPGVEFDITLGDVEALNRAALNGVHDITKLSFHAYLLVRDRYRLLNAGAALGFGCGPVVVAKRPVDRGALAGCSVAVPGELTTAHLLLRLFAPEARNKRFVRYDRVIELVQSGEVECGVIIHEDRFVYPRAGLLEIADLGDWWEKETAAPVPLGCIAMREELAEELGEAFDNLVRQSIALAKTDPETALPYIRAHARQMERDVLDRHIATFVNESSLDLGQEGRRALSKLEAMALKAGVIS
jgi:1,4-dihydroxy-6-naphthoate synthase